jgi:hypothetical protein
MKLTASHRIEMQARRRASRQPATQGVEQPADRRVQQQPILVRPEAATTQAIGPTGVFAILDPVFALAPHDVPRGARLRYIRPGGDDERSSPLSPLPLMNHPG